MATETPATPTAYMPAAAALRREAAAMERLQEQLGWAVLPNREPRIDAPTLRAVAALLETLEPE